VVSGDRVYITVDDKPKRSQDLKRLRNIGENPAVSLIVDHYEDDWDSLWWVRADGHARIADGELAQALVQRLVDKYHQYQERRPDGPVIEILVTRWSGWHSRPS